MKKSWYGLALAVILLAVVLLGCTFRTSRVELPEAEEPSRKVQVIRAQPKQGEATLYIGMAGQYTMHPYAYEGEATPDLDLCLTQEQLVQALLQEYEVSQEKAQESVEQFLGELQSNGFVQ